MTNWRVRFGNIGDVVARVREWRADYFMPPPSEWLDEACDEIERLRMTDVEIEAVQWALREAEMHAGSCVVASSDGIRHTATAAYLRGLLERHRALSTREGTDT